VGTRIELTRSGGLAGVSLVASVDLDDLPAATAKKLRAALAKVDFGPAAVPDAPLPGAADTFQYDLVVTDRRRRSLTAHDPIVSPPLQTLLDLLLPFARPE